MKKDITSIINTKMQSHDIERLMKRYRVSKEMSYLWWQNLLECYEYTQPNRNLYINQGVGQKKLARVFDSTAVLAVRNFTSKIHNALTPPGKRWANLVSGSKIPENAKEQIDEQLQVATKVLFEVINSSNFDQAVNEMYSDLAVGTGALMIQESDNDDSPINCVSVPTIFVYPEEGSDGTVQSVWRDYIDITPASVVEKWPRADLGHYIKSKLGSEPYSKIACIIEGSLWDENKKKYRYVVIEESTKHTLIDEYSASSPWILPRWSKLPGETYGRGPVMDVMPDVKTLNQAMMFTMEQAQMTVSPPIMAYDDGIFNPYTAVVKPATIIPIRPPNEGTGGGMYPLKALEMEGDINFGEILIQRWQNNINKGLFGNPIGEIRDTADHTATEMQIRQQMLLEEIGPAFGRLQVELLSKIIDRVVYILKKKGLFPPIEINGKEVSLKYQSPLTQTQDILDVYNFIQFKQALIGAVGEQMAVVALDLPKVPMWLAQKYNIDLKLVKSEVDIEQMQNNLVSQAQQEMSQNPQPQMQAAEGIQQMMPQ